MNRSPKELTWTYEFWETHHVHTIYTSSGCFIAGTPITMADGILKSIEEIQIGEWILSYDIKKGEQIRAEVCGIYRHGAEEMSGYILVNDILGVTPGHLMFINRRWREAATLQLNDYLMGTDGQRITVVKLEWINSKQPVYNLHTKHKTHNYFAEGVLVHNAKRQHGGPVSAGEAYIVGEERPELFVPNQNGTILPSVPTHISSSGPGALTSTPVGSMPFGAQTETSLSPKSIRDLADALYYKLAAVF